MEAAIFLVIAYVITKTKTWNKGPKITDKICMKRLLESFFDEGPLDWTYNEQDKEDPNSNPHYIWNEQDKVE